MTHGMLGINAHAILQRIYFQFDHSDSEESLSL